MRTELKSGVSDGRQEVHDGVRQCFLSYALRIDKHRKHRAGYLNELIRRYRFYVEPGASVLEVGVGTGDLLASLHPARGVGVDICPEMLVVARASHPELELYDAPDETVIPVHGRFDYIILSDLTVHVYDILNLLKNLQKFCHPRTRLIFNFHSRLWQPILHALTALGFHHRQYRTNWVTAEDLTNLLELAGYEVVRREKSTLLPAKLPPLTTLLNKYLFRLPVIQQFCLVNWIVARPKVPLAGIHELSVSIICPCRNEAGNVEDIVARVPSMGCKTEVIFVEGGSRDETWETICGEVARRTRRDLELKAFKQGGKGKADAVRLGCSKSTGDIVMILDADLTVPPEHLPACLQVLTEGKGEFINCSRLMYPMSDQAMGFMNLIANKTFALLFSYLLGQPIKDTLCGTKVLTRYDCERIAKGRRYFGEFDPFGDFDLLFGASKLNLRIVEFPIRYRERVYGETNIKRGRDGWRLIRMSWLGLKRLKFI